VQQLKPQPGEPAEKLALARRNLVRAERALADADADQALISAEAAMFFALRSWYVTISFVTRNNLARRHQP